MFRVKIPGRLLGNQELVSNSPTSTINFFPSGEWSVLLKSPETKFHAQMHNNGRPSLPLIFQTKSIQ